MHTDQYQLSYARHMTELEKGPQGLRRGRGARERILSASRQLFRDQGINPTGIDQLCAVAQVSKRTLYQHFAGKDDLIAEHLRRFDPEILPGVFDCTDLTPRERLLAAFDIRSPLCPFIAAAVEIHDPDHPARAYARNYKQAVAVRFTETAREAGATNPEQLGERTGATPGWSRGPQPSSQRLELLDRRRHRSSPHRQRHPRGSGTAQRSSQAVTHDRIRDPGVIDWTSAMPHERSTLVKAARGL